jgi:hypothetical protein
MMRSWRIFFSRGIPKRNFDIRRFDSHHQFHSFFHLNEHLENKHLIRTTDSFSLLQQRWQTTDLNRDGGSNVCVEGTVTGIDDQLQKLKEDVKKRQFSSYLTSLGWSRAVLTQQQSQQLISTLNEWIKDDHSDQEYANVLRSMSTLQFSVTNNDKQEIIMALTERFLLKNQHSAHSFVLFLTALRGLKYSGNSLNEKHRQRIVKLLSKFKGDRYKNLYSELLSGIVGLEISWDEINEAGKRNLLNQLKALKSEITADHTSSVLFNVGKLGVKLKESPYKKTILELTSRALKEIEKDNGQGKNDLPRMVSIKEIFSFATRLIYSIR